MFGYFPYILLIHMLGMLLLFLLLLMFRLHNLLYSYLMYIHLELLYMFLLLFFAWVVSFDGFDVATCFTASLSCLSNIGPGMTKLIGPAGSFAVFSPRTKVFLTFAMLLGRLEIYPILVLLIPRTWKR